MVNIKLEGNQAQIGFDDNPANVAAELAIAINGIYNGFRNRSPMMAKAFKKGIQICLAADSPTWEYRQNMTMITVPVKKGNDYGDS